MAEYLKRFAWYRFLRNVKELKAMNVALHDQIAERRHAEEKLKHYAIQLEEKTRALQESQDNFRNIVEKNTDGIVVLDRNHIVRFANRSAHRFFNYEPGDMLDKPFSHPVKPNTLTEIEIVDAVGNATVMEMSVTDTQWQNRPAYLANLRNITERKQTEDRMREANENLMRLNRLRSEFTSIVSHELRTPLTAIKESIDLVLEGVDGPLSDSQKTTLGITKNNVDRLARLIHNVLDFSRIEAGKFKLDIGRQDMRALVSEVFDFMKFATQKKDLHFSLNCPPEAVIVACDADKIKQVLINLIDNAIKFTNPSGHITLHLIRKEYECTIEIEDTGIGIQADDLSKIFEMFGQSFYKGRRTGGVGVGLAVCKQLINLHGGIISVASIPEKGSRFIVTLPA